MVFTVSSEYRCQGVAPNWPGQALGGPIILMLSQSGLWKITATYMWCSPMPCGNAPDWPPPVNSIKPLSAPLIESL